jgi:hypothetical protein
MPRLRVSILVVTVIGLTAWAVALTGAAEKEAKSRGPLPAFNALILRQISGLPTGGGYDTSNAATARLGEAIALAANGALEFRPKSAEPSYCSGATYLVFLKAIQALRASRKLALPAPAVDSLLIRDQPNRPDRLPTEWGPRDGEGVWGRWNANGPGTARLFYELGLGRNFEDFAQARTGDFLKIFWTAEIGRRERGHSVIYLGRAKRDGVEYVRFWSSNQAGGFGAKEVPRATIERAVFSRLEFPEALAKAAALPPVDEYLASLQRVDSSIEELRGKCGMDGASGK